MSLRPLVSTVAFTSIVLLAVTGFPTKSLASVKLIYDGNGHCYQRLETPTTWHTARNQCQTLGGYLATLTSVGENNFVYTNLINTASTSGWGGATDEVVEGVWQWITSEVWSYTNWAPGEPNNFGNEDYLELSKLFGKWNDDAGANWHPICEWEPTVEICDGLDNDCDELIDEGPDLDGDGVSICHGDCNDSNPAVYPGAPEICDGLDNDCNLLVDQNDPAKVDNDTDGDGLWDCWELYGIDIDGNQVIDLPLNTNPYNANREVRDLFVEVDYLVGVDHSHDPFRDALDRVTQAFWTNSITSSGAYRPINLHWIIDEVIPETPLIEDINGSEFNTVQYGVIENYPDPTIVCNPGNEGHFGSSADRRAANCQAIIRAKSFVLRYLLMSHDIKSGWSGASREPDIGECSSTGFAVAEGKRNFVVNVAEFFGGLFLEEAIDRQAGVLMHELGHSLGLLHGGATGTQCKPNYVSVMSYSRMHRYSGFTRGVPSFSDGTKLRVNRELNYSSELLATLDESMLMESDGIGSAVNALVLYSVNGVPTVGPATSALDWNGNGVLEDPVGSTLDINAISTIAGCDGINDRDPTGTPTHFLSGHHDWDKVLSCLPLPDAPLPAMASANMTSFAQIVLTTDFEQEPTEEDYFNGSLGSNDVDSDGVNNVLDICPLDADPNQENSDGDIRGDACDCLLADPSAWAKPPSEVRELVFQGSQTLEWKRSPDFFGATTVQYDTVRSSNPSDFVSAFTCVESGDGSDMLAIDTSMPSEGRVFYYLVRARNACPNSEGTLGTSSDGVERIGASCP